MAGFKSVKLEGNVDATQSVCCWSSEASVSVSLGEVKALIVIDRLQEFPAQRLYACVLGKVQQVKAGVGYGQVVLPSAGGLDHQLEAFHAQDGDAVTSCQEHCEDRRQKRAVKQGNSTTTLGMKMEGRQTLTQKLLFLLERKFMEDLPEEPNGGMFCPVFPFVLGTLRNKEDEYHSE